MTKQVSDRGPPPGPSFRLSRFGAESFQDIHSIVKTIQRRSLELAWLTDSVKSEILQSLMGEVGRAA